MKDLYKILGVPEGADDAAIKKAYRKLAKELHPDATGGDKKKTERFKEVNEAYDVLSDKKKRGEYDRLRRAPVGADGMPEGFDAEAFARTFGGTRVRGGATFGGGEYVDINDLFSSLFGGRGGSFGGEAWGPRRTRVARGSDLVGTLELSFAEAALGTRRTVRTGGGATAEVAVPPGVEAGARLRVPGQGAPAPGKGTPGDLYLEIVVRPDPFLRRSGDDLELTLPLTVAEAALGAKVEVPTVDGPVTVTVPPGTSSGGRLRLRGRGIKRSDGSRGDQYCRVEIVVPNAATDPELRKLLEAVARHPAVRPTRPFHG